MILHLSRMSIRNVMMIIGTFIMPKKCKGYTGMMMESIPVPHRSTPVLEPINNINTGLQTDRARQRRSPA